MPTVGLMKWPVVLQMLLLLGTLGLPVLARWKDRFFSEIQIPDYSRYSERGFHVGTGRKMNNPNPSLVPLQGGSRGGLGRPRTSLVLKARMLEGNQMFRSQPGGSPDAARKMLFLCLLGELWQPHYISV